ncbi:HNH endonuclease [Deinococcus phoenicis]|uniref:HNH endonuclease n=1 Tax=Deinococcus phoenicis TaxID=1476583 RepID=UPI001376EBBF|nr:HNH endonuclease [Deinococcus phoenicis]
MRFLELHGKHAEGEYATTLVDADVYDRVAPYRWYFDFKRIRAVDGSKHGYVATRIEKAPGHIVRRSLHWMVLGIEELPEGVVVDHINGDPLDNRRRNLRLVNPTQSALNRRAARGKSGYRGVRHIEKENRFVAILKLHGERVDLGSFRCAREAARQWDIFALLVGGEVAASQTNFPAQQYARRVEALRRMLTQSWGLSHPMG